MRKAPAPTRWSEAGASSNPDAWAAYLKASSNRAFCSMA